MKLSVGELPHGLWTSGDDMAPEPAGREPIL
jgi:hypothetical protein